MLKGIYGHTTIAVLKIDNSARKSTADISVHPIQVGNTAMESILTMVGYMYIAIGEALKGEPDYR